MKRDKKSLRIVYMGTPEFAVASLKALVEGGYNVVGVVTMPDKPVGRHGSVLQASPVKQYAVQKGLKVLQPERLKDEAFLEELRALSADLQIVVAFRMLPEVVWSMPPLGTFNAHASLLPKYRGAAPINWAVIRGERETGMTTFMLKHEIDTGDIIQQVRVPIFESDNAGTLHDRLMTLSASLVTETVDSLINGTLITHPQQDAEATDAPKIFRDTCKIEWNRPTVEVHNFIRGLSPYPGAWTMLDGKVLKIFESIPLVGAHEAPGTLYSDGRSVLEFSTADGVIRVKTLQMEGKKRMPTEDFLRGAKL